jgi:pilus assembly protein CpaF
VRIVAVSGIEEGRDLADSISSVDSGMRAEKIGYIVLISECGLKHGLASYEEYNRLFDEFDSNSFKNYVRAKGVCGQALVVGENEISESVFFAIGEAYDLMILDRRYPWSGKMPGNIPIPLVYFLGACERAEVSRMCRNAAKEIGSSSPFVPVGFAMRSHDLHSSVVIARRSELAFIGSFDDPSIVARRLFDHSALYESCVRVGEVLGYESSQKPPSLPRPSSPAAVINSELCATDLLGCQAISDLLGDEDVTEIMVNGYDRIYVEKSGIISKENCSFESSEALLSSIERLISYSNRRIDELHPMADARLSDGSRINAAIPPISIDGPVMTIRKFRRDVASAKDIVEGGTISADAMEFLMKCVASRGSILISGGTGSGKTTLLGILGSAIPSSERIITIEDAAELSLKTDHVVRFESRPPNIEGRGEISIRDLLKNALRMRPDRIIIGECRGAEAVDMLQAMNTGHEGSLATIHANSPKDALSRLETMVLMAKVEIPILAIREQIARAIDFVVQVVRFADGRRRVVSISEITGIDSGVIGMQSLYEYRKKGDLLFSTGMRASFFDSGDTAGEFL